MREPLGRELDTRSNLAVILLATYLGTSCAVRQGPVACDLTGMPGTWELKASNPFVLLVGIAYASGDSVLMRASEVGTGRGTPRPIVLQARHIRFIRDSVQFRAQEVGEIWRRPYSFAGHCDGQGALAGSYSAPSGAVGHWSMRRLSGGDGWKRVPSLNHAVTQPSTPTQFWLRAGLYLAAVCAALALLIWVVATRRTDPAGYTHIASSSSTEEAERARQELERHGVPARLDEPIFRYGQVAVRILVPSERLAEAGTVLRSYIAAEQREHYMHVV